ncbi:MULTISPECIES: hypothetical protein [Microbacterium]|uniref:Uncharacterized protein n=1 Tax=Microbacterium resistens TaxID=156977 RepID=A0ABY3RRY0_9MICO|nr:hypothetical protein [Microbacterium resistens]MBW1639580.1 hypothetical protein [Microbacterium resistens]MDA4895590.1 hypothetical protein [Streptomyces sp. MS2A]UGS26838.1 hypothetical protein K8F61_00965 [Microbacterium resistens]
MIDALVRAAVSPSPTPTPTVDPELVTPGPWGFAIVAILVIGVVVLIWDMQRRIRRVRYREEVRAELDAEAQADAAVEATTADDQAVDPEDAAGDGPRGSAGKTE